MNHKQGYYIDITGIACKIQELMCQESVPIILEKGRNAATLDAT